MQKQRCSNSKCRYSMVPIEIYSKKKNIGICSLCGSNTVLICPGCGAIIQYQENIKIPAYCYDCSQMRNKQFIIQIVRTFLTVLTAIPAMITIIPNLIRILRNGKNTPTKE